MNFYGGGPADDGRQDWHAIEQRAKSFIRTPDTWKRTKALLIVVPSGIVLAWGLQSMGLFFMPGAGPEVILLSLMGFGMVAVSAFFGLRGLRLLSEYRAEFARAEPKPPLSTVRKRLAGGLKRVRGLVDDAVGVLPESVVYGPIHVVGPALPAYGFLDDEGRAYFSRYEVVVVYVTDYNFVAFTAVYDFILNRLVLEQVQEFAICDVVSVEIVRLPVGAAARKQYYEVPEPPLGGEPIWRLSEDSMTPMYLITMSVASGQQITINAAEQKTLALGHLIGRPVDPVQLVGSLRALAREYKRKVAADPDRPEPLDDLPPLAPSHARPHPRPAPVR